MLKVVLEVVLEVVLDESRSARCFMPVPGILHIVDTTRADERVPWCPIHEGLLMEPLLRDYGHLLSVEFVDVSRHMEVDSGFSEGCIGVHSGEGNRSTV